MHSAHFSISTNGTQQNKLLHDGDSVVWSQLHFSGTPALDDVSFLPYHIEGSTQLSAGNRASTDKPEWLANAAGAAGSFSAGNYPVTFLHAGGCHSYGNVEN